ncbi:MAG: SDR family NAD(P)-dependent oxidoreductase [Polyangiaceae bacterium]|nr:SDR family NAD(P)-dependent oxidoreductase [Polyangiaceae bacterium]MCW5792187.1 SDR family NAD(P)-dependent oxidoreductase [Polyangiaceae bacterium]
MKRLSGRVAAITGAGSGIGAATALHLAREGCHVALCDMNTEGLEATRERAQALGVRATAHRVDVASEAEMRGWVSDVVSAHQGVNILINNAGVAATATLEDQELDEYRWLVGVNFWGVVHGCKLFLPHLKAADEAHIVNISSMFGLIGVPTQSAYCATKFAVRGFTEALWCELEPLGIGVTSVHPGMIATGIVKSGRMSEAEESTRGKLIARFESSGMSPERAARRIVRAISSGKQRQLIGAEAYVTDWLRRATPELGMHLAARATERLKRLLG